VHESNLSLCLAGTFLGSAVLFCVAGCCSMIQRVVMCCSALQCVAVCRIEVQESNTVSQCSTSSTLRQVAAARGHDSMCRSVLQCVAAARDYDMCPSVLQCGAIVEHLPLPFWHLFWICRVTNVLQGVAGCCNVLQYVAL